MGSASTLVGQRCVAAAREFGTRVREPVTGVRGFATRVRTSSINASSLGNVVQDLAAFVVQARIGRQREDLEHLSLERTWVDHEHGIAQHLHAHDGRSLA
jgi:hypothetical protein